MNIEETLSVWGAQYEKCEAAYQEYMRLKIEMRDVLYDNEEQFEVLTISGNYTGITLKTPPDMDNFASGCVISIGGVEWFHTPGCWLSSFNTKKDEHEMFAHILRHRKHVYLIHGGY